MNPESWYYDKDNVAREVIDGNHRNAIGGMWEEIGQLQFDFMIRNGLAPQHKLLDIGCGCLRGGVKFVDYLDAGNYFGIDLNASLLEAGRQEIAQLNLSDKLPHSNLAQADQFQASSFGKVFDYAIALSVFTHITLNSMRICMERLTEVMKRDGQFFATVWIIPNTQPTSQPVVHSPHDVLTYGDKDSYHYRPSDLEFIVRDLPWCLDHVRDFDHPRGQKIARFTRL